MDKDPRVIVDELEARLLADSDAGPVDDREDDEQVQPVAEDVSPHTPYIEPTD